MNTILTIRTVLCLSFALSAFFLMSNPASATVGGPTTIHSFTYNPQDESVYFIEEDGGGRGCQPVLKKISLNTSKVDVVYSCEQGEQASQLAGGYSEGSAMIEIQKITEGFKTLAQISLPQNGFEIDVDFNKDIYLENTPEYLLAKEFTSTVFQNKKSISQHTIRGCRVEQPFTYAGYAIPGFEAKIILLASAVGDCFESGYVDENLFVVSGVSNLNREYYSNMIKGRYPLVVSEATLVVFESAEVAEDQDPGVTDDVNGDQTQDDEGGMLRILAIFALGLAVLALGIYVGKSTTIRV